MFKRVVKSHLITACIISLVLSSCATMFAPSKDEITIKTDPEGADVYEGVNLLGKTPLTHTFDRETSGQKVLTIKKQGHKSHKLELGKTLEEKALLNFVFFLTTMGATSWGIDAISGNMVKYSPD